MSEENLIYLLIIALIGSIAVSVSYFITRRETNARNVSNRLQWLGKQTLHCLEAISMLKAAGCMPELLDRLNHHALRYIEEISTLAPDSDLMTQVNAQKETADRMTQGQRGFTSDRDLKRFQIYVNYTENLLKDMVEKNELPYALGSSYAKELYWLNIRVVANAHVSQANQLLTENDKLTALSHYKHAKAVLVRAMVPPKQKQPLIDEIQPRILELEPKKIYRGGALEDSLDNYLG